MRYYDAQKHWRKVRPVITSPEATAILAREFHRLDSRGLRSGMQPCCYDCTDWLLFRDARWGKRGPRPAFFDFVCHGACHWLVHLNLFVACLVEPTRAWQIVSSDLHSTVWDGKHLLFDLNFLAFDIPPPECLAMARGSRSRGGGGPGDIIYNHNRLSGVLGVKRVTPLENRPVVEGLT